MTPQPASKKFWFITGASQGLGLETSLAALRNGHRVIGTARSVDRAKSNSPEFEALGGQWLQLDVSQPEAQQTIEAAVAREENSLNHAEEPPHWVVVNNAGNTLLGAVEDMSEAQIEWYLQTNLFGAVRVWKAMLPTLRRHRCGTVVTVSSIWGFACKPEQMMYCAAKAAAESLTESYAALLAPFGIRTFIVEPGGFRTKFPGNCLRADLGTHEDLKDTVEEWTRIVDATGKDPTIVGGDPSRFGASMLDAVEERGLFEHVWETQKAETVLRIQFGSDCYTLFGQRLQELNDNYRKMAEIAKFTDVAG